MKQGNVAQSNAVDLNGQGAVCGITSSVPGQPGPTNKPSTGGENGK